MKIAFPHMGNAYIPLKGLVEELGLEAVVPPRPSQVSLRRGALHSPEFVCLPFKVTLGDCMAALDQGADTLAMVCGMWACRFGYYGRIQHLILRDLGYEFESVLVGREEVEEVLAKLKGAVGRGWRRKLVRALAFFRAKARAVDELERMATWTRPREAVRGMADRVLGEYLAGVDAASTLGETRKRVEEARQAFRSIPLTGEPVARVRVVGELYVLLEPALNLDLVRRLAWNCRVEARPVLSTYRWLLHPVWLDPRLNLESYRARRKVRPYLPQVLGGEEHMTLAGALTARGDGFDGLIHALPLTCMPENICRTLLPDLCRKLDLPLLTLVFDEHTSTAGLDARLEAFTDLLVSRKGARRGIGNGPGREAFPHFLARGTQGIVSPRGRASPPQDF